MEKEDMSSETMEITQGKSNSEIDADKQGMSFSANNITKLSLSAAKKDNNDSVENHNDKVKLENTTTCSSIKSSELSELSSSSLSSSFSPHENITMLKKVPFNSDNRRHYYESQSCKSEKELLESLKNSSSTSKEQKSHNNRNVYYYSHPAKKLVVREHGPFTARPHYYSNNHHNNNHEHNQFQKQLECSSQVNSLLSSASNSEPSSLQKEYNGVSISDENLNNVTHSNVSNNPVVQKSAMTTARSCCSSSISSISESMLPTGCHYKESNTESVKREDYILIKEKTNLTAYDSVKKQEHKEKELELEEFVEKEKVDYKRQKSEDKLEKLSKLDITELEKLKSSWLVDSQVITTEPVTTPTEESQLLLEKECTKTEHQQLEKGKINPKNEEVIEKNSLEHNAITHKASFTAKSPSAKIERINSLHESFSSVSISPLSRKDSSLSASQIAERAQRKSLILGLDKKVNDSFYSKNDSNTKTKENIYAINNDDNDSRSKSMNVMDKPQCEADQTTERIVNQTGEATEKSNTESWTSEACIAKFNSNSYYHNNNIHKERDNHHDSEIKQGESVLQHIIVEERHNAEVQHFTSQLLCGKTSSSLGEQSKEHNLSDNSKSSSLESKREEEKKSDKNQLGVQIEKKDDSESHSSPLPRLPILFSSTTLKSSNDAWPNSDYYHTNVKKKVSQSTNADIANKNFNSTTIINYNNTINGAGEDKLIYAKLENENINMKNNDMENLNDIINNNNNNNLISSELTQSYESLSPTLLRSSNFLSISSMTNNNNNNTNTTNINNNYNYSNNNNNLQHSTLLDHSESSNSCSGDNKYDINKNNNTDINNNSCTNTNSIKDSLRQMTSTSFTPNTTLVISPISEVSDYFVTYERNLSELLQHNSLASKWKLKEESHDNITTNNTYNKNNNNEGETVVSGHTTQTEKETEECNFNEKKINSSTSNSYYKDYNYKNETLNKVENDTKCDQLSMREISKINYNNDTYENEEDNDTDDDFHYSVSQPSPSLSPSLNISFSSEQHKNLHYLAQFRISPHNYNNTIITKTNTNYNDNFNTVGKSINVNEDENQYISANSNYCNNDNNKTMIINHNMESMTRERDVESCYVPVSATMSVSTLADPASSPIIYSSTLLTRPTINENWTFHTNIATATSNNDTNNDTINICASNSYHRDINNYNFNSNSFSVSSSISSITTPLTNTNASITLVTIDTTDNSNMNINNNNEYSMQHEKIDEKEHNELSHTLAERPEHWPAPPIPVMRRPPIVPLNENDLNSESHTILTPFLLYSNHKDENFTHSNNYQPMEEKETKEENYETNDVKEISDTHKDEENSKEEIYNQSAEKEEVHENNTIDSTALTIEINNDNERCDEKYNEIDNEGNNVIDGLKEETKKSARPIEENVADINNRDDKEQIHQHNTEFKTALDKENELTNNEHSKASKVVIGGNQEAITKSIHNKKSNSMKKTSLPNDLRAQLQELERFEAENEAALTHYNKFSHRRRHNRTVTHQLFWEHSSKLQALQTEADKREEENAKNNTAALESIKEKQEQEEKNNWKSDKTSNESSVKQENVNSDYSTQQQLSEKEEKDEIKRAMTELVSEEWKGQEMQTNQAMEEEKEEKNAEVEKEILQSESLTYSPSAANDDNKEKIKNDELEEDQRKEEEKNTDGEAENTETYKDSRQDDNEYKHVKEIVEKTKNCSVEEQERATEINIQPDKDVVTRTSVEENKAETQFMPIPLHTSYASSRFKFRQAERDQQRARVEAIEQFCHFAAKERKSNNNCNNINNDIANNDKIVKEEHTFASSTNPLNMMVTSLTSLPPSSSSPLSLLSLQSNEKHHEKKEHEHKEEEKYSNGKESVFTRLSRSKSPYFNRAVHHLHEKVKKTNVKNDKNTTWSDKSKNKRNHFLLNTISETHTEPHQMQKANTLGEHDKSKLWTLKSNNNNTTNKEITFHNTTHTKLTKQGECEGNNQCRLERFRSIKSACSLNSISTNHHKYNITFLDDINSDNNNSVRPLPLSSVETRRRPVQKSKCRAISSPPERSRVNKNCKEKHNKFETSEKDSEVLKMSKRSVVTFTLSTYNKQEELESEQEKEECKEETKKYKNDINKSKEHTHEYNKRKRNNTKNTNYMQNSSNSSSSDILNFMNSNKTSNNMYKTSNNGVTKTEREMDMNAKYERAATSTFTHPLRSSSPSSRTSILLPEKFKSSLSSISSSSSPKLASSLPHELGKIEKNSKMNEVHTRIHIPSQRVLKLEYENAKNHENVKENEMETNKNNTNVDVVKTNRCNYNKENILQKFTRFTRTHSPSKGKATIVAQNVTYNSDENNKIVRYSDQREDKNKEREQEEKNVHVKQKLLHTHSMVNSKQIPL